MAYASIKQTFLPGHSVGVRARGAKKDLLLAREIRNGLMRRAHPGIRQSVSL